MIKDNFLFFSSGILGNWYKSPFVDGSGNYFENVETYFQWCKSSHFKDYGVSKKILRSITPAVAKRLGQEVGGFDEDEWKKVNKKYMKEGLLLKFTQNDSAKAHLMSTFPKELVQASFKDTYWGIGVGIGDPDLHDRLKWRGTNYLGKALMSVRDELMSDEKNLQDHPVFI